MSHNSLFFFLLARSSSSSVTVLVNSSSDRSSGGPAGTGGAGESGAEGGTHPPAGTSPLTLPRKCSFTGTSLNGVFSRKNFNKYRWYGGSNRPGPLVNSTIVGGLVDA